MTRPSRSRIFPRGAGMGKDLMRLRSACSLYSWGFWTCRFQKPVIRNRKMRTPAYWKKAIFPAASDDAAVAVQDLSAGRGNRQGLDAVALGLFVVQLGVLDLQVQNPQ